MSFIDDIKIGKKLIGGFLIVILLIVIVAMVGLTSMGSMSANSATMYNDRTVPIDQLGNTAADMQQMRAEIYRYIYVPESRTDIEQTTIPALRADITKNMDAYRATYLLDDEKINLAKFDTAYAEWNRQYDATIAAVKANDRAAYEAQLKAGSPLITARTDVVTANKNLLAINVKEAERLNGVSTALAGSSSMLVIVTTILGVIVSLAIAVYLTRSIAGPVNQVKTNIREIHLGHLDNRLHMERKDEIGEMAATMDRFSEDMQKYVVGTLKMIADGDLSRNLKPRDEKDEIVPAMKTTIETLRSFVSDAQQAARAAEEGRLNSRSDASKYKGDLKKVIEGFNTTLDSVIGPLNMAANYVDRIGKGDIPPKITDKYNGDFNEIKNNLNNCIDNINRLVEDASLLAKAAEEGNLTVRADVSRHHGDYRKIVEGVNNSLDHVIQPVNEAMRISEQYSHCNFNARMDERLRVSGDFVRFKNALNNIGTCVQETIGLVTTQTCENAKCNFTARIDDTAHIRGDFVTIKNSLNNVTNEVSKAFSSVNSQINDLAANAQEATASAKEVAAGASSVASSVSNVSIAAEKGNEGIKQILRAVEDLSASVEEITSNTDSVTNLARDANKLTQSGAELAGQAEQGMASITKSSAEVDAIIGDIKARMNKIGEIVEIITNLANQTNLLALNAAIEAARAGDAGKGFAVVATEVKSLAEESRESAENIGRMIGSLQEQSEKAASAMAEANKEVRIGSDALAETLVFFNKIVKSVDEFSTSMEEVAKASAAQTKSVVELTANVQNVSLVIQSTAKEAVDAAAATEETSASIDQIAHVIGNVNRIVENVTGETSKFRV